MKRIVFCMIALFAASSCRPTVLLSVDPSGPPEYNLGWEDGCDTGISAEGEWYYKVMFGFKKRPEMAANDQYKQGWNEGFSYCRFSLDTSQNAGNFGDVGLGAGF
jgi:hypothetical protein